MLVYQMQTAHVHQLDLRQIARESLDKYRPILTPGVHSMPGKAASYLLECHIRGVGLFARIMTPDWRLCAGFGVAPNDAAAQQLWPFLEERYIALCDQPYFRALGYAPSQCPKSTPWCGMYTTGAKAEDDELLNEAIVCVAAAWLEKLGEPLP